MGLTVEDYMRAISKGVRAGMRNVLMLEPQAGPWANNNVWGEQRNAPIPGQEGAIVQLLPKNTVMYGPPAVHSVNLARSDGLVAQNADVYARVSYGCGAIRNEFLVDWLHGCQFSLVCNSLTVDALSYRPSIISPYNATDAVVFLGVMVSKGTVAQGRCPATKTEALAEIPAGQVYSIPVPDFAREVTVHLRMGAALDVLNSNPAVPTNVIISCTVAGAGVLSRYDAQVCAGGRSIPIPGGSTEVRIVNATANDVTMTPQFFLGL